MTKKPGLGRPSYNLWMLGSLDLGLLGRQSHFADLGRRNYEDGGKARNNDQETSTEWTVSEDGYA